MAPTVEIDQAKFEAFLSQVFGDLAACYGGVMVSWATGSVSTRPSTAPVR
jgi:hypothetical protein